MTIFYKALPSVIISGLLLSFSTNVFSSDSNKYKDECIKYAQEDKVTESEMAEYMQMCIQDLKEADSYNKATDEPTMKEDLN